MHNDYKRRNFLAVISVVLIVAFFATAFFVFQFHPTEETAYIEYWIDGNMRVNFYGDNFVVLDCANRGSKEGSFYLALKVENASFSNQTSQPYERIGERSVKIPFALQRSGDPLDSKTKNVFFKIDKNVRSFFFSVSIEGYGQNPVSGGVGLISYLLYEWNETGQFYEKSEGGGAVA